MMALGSHYANPVRCCLRGGMLLGAPAFAQPPLSNLPSTTKLFKGPLKSATLPWEQYLVYTGEDGVSLPKVLKTVGVHYTPEAFKANIQGKVVVEAVVKPDGNVGDVKLLQ